MRLFFREGWNGMIRQWLKILVLVFALLSQLAMACPKDTGQDSSQGSSPSRRAY